MAVARAKKVTQQEFLRRKMPASEACLDLKKKKYGDWKEEFEAAIEAYSLALKGVRERT